MSKAKKSSEGKRVDWMITLVPFIIIVVLCVFFFFAPDQSNEILGQIRFMLGDVLGTYYLAVGLGVFLFSLFIAASRYGNVVLGDKGEKPKLSFFAWGSMMFTAGRRYLILFLFGMDFVRIRSVYRAARKHSGLGERVSFVSLEFHSMGLLSGIGRSVRFYASCAEKGASEIFGGLQADSWQTDRWHFRTCYRSAGGFCASGGYRNNVFAGDSAYGRHNK